MEYVRSEVHTQGIENFRSLLKRGLKGTYVAVEPFHLDRYVTRQVFRFITAQPKIIRWTTQIGLCWQCRRLQESASPMQT